MEFFIIFMGLFTFCHPLLKEYMPVWPCSTAIIVAACVYAVIYAFKAVALFTMAKRAGKKKLLWCAFVPFASTYLMGELAGQPSFFKHKIKKIGLIAMIIELVAAIALICAYAPEVYIIGGGYYYEPNPGDTQLFILEEIPIWLLNMNRIGSILNNIFNWIYLIAFIFLHIAVFRVYYARGYVIFTILSALFPISAFFLFAVRNNAPIDYEKYIKEQMERMRRAQQGYPYGNPYGNPYGGYPNGRNTYNGGDYGAPSEPPDDPFGEYSADPDKKSGSGDKNGDDDFFN